jgi:hypothetical protein
VLLFEPLHAYMQTGQLKGIKQRAERLVSLRCTATSGP